jgi:1-deoxy-D-xylulose-5-phosphate reductoisomerase
VIRLAILGSTGSIGRSALAVVASHPDRLKVAVLAAGGNAALLAEQVAAVRPEAVAVATEAARAELAARLGDGVQILPVGADGLLAAATHPDVDIVLCASSGTAGLEAALVALGEGRTLALANKEVLVMAGSLMVEAARRHGAVILPVDSEHNAIHQCLDGRQLADVRRLILTASGGPFRTLDREALSRVTPADALRHPTWRMGRKITIDSATMMNKGLEVIEARWLFDMEPERVQVVIHPQSIVHSLVEYVDGSMIAQLSNPDMRVPIAHALGFPDRIESGASPLDLGAIGQLSFERPDLERFPCLALAYSALRAGGGAPAVLNAANEVAVESFLSGRLRFTGIPDIISGTLDSVNAGSAGDLASVLDADARARQKAAAIVAHVMGRAA